MIGQVLYLEDAGGWVNQKWQFQRVVIIDQPHISLSRGKLIVAYSLVPIRRGVGKIPKT